MTYHDKDMVDEFLVVMKDALILYYDFKILMKLTPKQRTEFKAVIERTMKEIEDEGV